MSLVIPQQGEIDALAAFITAVLDGVKLRLFSSNLTPGPSTTLSALLAAETTFTGYAANTLTVWSTPTIDLTGRAATACTQPSFTGTAAGGTGSLYGYFYTDSGGTKLYGAERFTGAPLSFAQNIAFNFDTTYTFLSQA